MTGRFQVRQEQLTAHAVHVESAADQVTAAAQAGASIRAGRAAYGKLCVLVPVTLDVLQDILVDGISTTADSLADTGARLRLTARDYRGADERSASAVRRS